MGSTAILFAISPARVKEYFASGKPQTVSGKLALARVLLAEGQKARAAELVESDPYLRDEYAPLLSTEQAHAMVDAFRFAPLGHRSIAGGYPQFGFAAVPINEVVAGMNEATLVVAMLETPRATGLLTFAPPR